MSTLVDYYLKRYSCRNGKLPQTVKYTFTIMGTIVEKRHSLLKKTENKSHNTTLGLLAGMQYINTG